MIKEEHALVLVLLLQSALHLFLLNAPFQVDEGYFLSSSWFATQGKVFLIDVHGIRPPGTVLFGWFIFTLFGSSIDAARVGIALIQLLTSALVFLLGKEITSKRNSFLIAAAYALAEPALGGFRFLADPLLVFFGTASVFFLLKYMKKEESQDIVLSGLCVGWMLLVRQSSIYHFAFLILFLLFARKRVFSFILAALLPIMLVALFYIEKGMMFEILQQMFSPSLAFTFFSRLNDYFLLYFLLFIPVVLWVPEILKYIRTRKKQELLLFYLWAVAGFLILFPEPLHIHLLQALPGVIFLTVLLPGKRKTNYIRYVSAAAVLFFVLLSALFAFTGGKLFIEEEVKDLDELIQTIQSTTDENDSITAYPHFPLYLSAKRNAGSFYSTLMPHWISDNVRERALADLKGNKPKYFIKSDELNYAPEISYYVEKNYRKEKAFDYSGFHITVYRLIE